MRGNEDETAHLLAPREDRNFQKEIISQIARRDKGLAFGSAMTNTFSSHRGRGAQTKLLQHCPTPGTGLLSGRLAPEVRTVSSQMIMLPGGQLTISQMSL